MVGAAQARFAHPTPGLRIAAPVPWRCGSAPLDRAVWAGEV